MKGQIQAMFLRHEGYLGAIGAFLKGVEEEGKCLGFFTRLADAEYLKKKEPIMVVSIT